MKKSLFLLSFLIFDMLLAQEPILGTWYIIEYDGKSSQRIVLTSDALITERFKTYGVEEPYWEKDKESSISSLERKVSSYQMVGFSEDKNQYFAGEVWVSNNGELNIFQQLGSSSSEDEALKKLKEVPSKRLLTKTYYSKKRMEEIKQLPTLENLTKDNLIAVMQATLQYSKELEEYINNSSEKHARFMAVKAIENLRNQKFLALGYNPYIFTDPYYMDRFQEDAEVQELNERMTLMKF